MSANWPPPPPPAPYSYGGDPYGHRPHWGWIVPIFVVGLVLVLFVALFLWLNPFYGPPYDHSRWWFFFPFGLLFLLFVVFFAVRVVFWSYRWGPGGRHYRRYGPRAILQARYARGEITRDQYLQMMRDLDESRGSPGAGPP